MTLRGQVKNGKVVLNNGVSLPDGTEVTVRLLKKKSKPRTSKKPSSKPGQRLMKYAGKAQGLPPDAARNLDHYLYGHAKR